MNIFPSIKIPFTTFLSIIISTLLLINSSFAAQTVNVENKIWDEPLLIASLIEDEKTLNTIPLQLNEREKTQSSWALYLDNDILALGQNDRDYTGGMSFTYTGENAKSQIFSVDSVLEMTNRDSDERHNNKVLYSFELGLTAFTPENIETESILVDDRPYASLIYVSNSRQYINLSKKSSIITSLTIGILGSSIPAKVQNKIHESVNSTPAQGWQHQISDGGELTFRYSRAKQQVRWASYSRENFNYEIKTANNVSIGYLTEASWSVSGRFGKLRSPWSNFNPQNVAYSEKNVPLTNESITPKSEFYVWAGLSVHARVYNALLQGQFRNSAVTYNSDELKHVVNEAWFGITKEFESGIRISYFLRGQTAEIKSGPGARNPVWGGIIISQPV